MELTYKVDFKRMDENYNTVNEPYSRMDQHHKLITDRQFSMEYGLLAGSSGKIHILMRNDDITLHATPR